MTDEEDFLFRPVRAGMCRYESLKDGTVSLYDVFLMNECLDVEAENQHRLAEYRDRHGSR